MLSNRASLTTASGTLTPTGDCWGQQGQARVEPPISPHKLLLFPCWSPGWKDHRPPPLLSSHHTSSHRSASSGSRFSGWEGGNRNPAHWWRWRCEGAGSSLQQSHCWQTALTTQGKRNWDALQHGSSLACPPNHSYPGPSGHKTFPYCPWQLHFWQLLNITINLLNNLRNHFPFVGVPIVYNFHKYE